MLSVNIMDVVVLIVIILSVIIRIKDLLTQQDLVYQ
jgi:hypothetical protein